MTTARQSLSVRLRLPGRPYSIKPPRGLTHFKPTWGGGGGRCLIETGRVFERGAYQEPITWSEQLPRPLVTAFSRTILFLERFWRKFRISDNRASNSWFTLRYTIIIIYEKSAVGGRWKQEWARAHNCWCCFEGGGSEKLWKTFLLWFSWQLWVEYFFLSSFSLCNVYVKQWRSASSLCWRVALRIPLHAFKFIYSLNSTQLQGEQTGSCI